MQKWICNTCGCAFDEDESGATYEMVGEGFMRGLCPMEMCCPECRSQNIEEAKECEICGEYFNPWTDMIMVGDMRYCKECAKAVVDAFNDKWQKIKAS